MGHGCHQSVFPLVVVSQLNKQLLNGGHFLKSLKHLGALLCHLESGCQGAMSVKCDKGVGSSGEIRVLPRLLATL